MLNTEVLQRHVVSGCASRVSWRFTTTYILGHHLSAISPALVLPTTRFMKNVLDLEVISICQSLSHFTNSVFNAMRRLLKRCWPLRPGYLSSGFKSIRLFTWRAIAALATSLRFGKKNALQNIAFTMAFNLGCLSSQCSGPDRYRVWAHETLCTI